MIGRLSVVVCTRNRPNHLRRLLGSMADSLDDAEVGTLRVLVIDDSTGGSGVDASALRSNLSDSSVDLTVIGATEFDELAKSIEQVVPGLTLGALPVLKRPSTEVWSPGGTRNVGFLLAAASASREPVLFLDDDVAFGDIELRDGRILSADPFSRVLAELLSEAASPGCRAVGVRFLGCPDLSLVSHLEFMVESLRSRIPSQRELAASLLSDFPRLEPTLTQLTERDAVSPSAYRGPGGISAGVMLVADRDALVEAPQPPCYNEDWIWLLSITSDERTLRRADVVVAHLAEDYEFDSRQLHLQERGELLYDALASPSTTLLASLHRSDVEGFRLELLELLSIAVRERTARVDVIRRAVKAAQDDGTFSTKAMRHALDQLEDLLGDLADGLNDRIVGEVADIGSSWLAKVAAWRELCSALRERREILPDALRL